MSYNDLSYEVLYVGPVSDKESDKNKKGKNKVNKGKFSRDKGIETGMSSERMNVDERVFSNTVKVKNGGGKNINEDGGSSKGNAKKGFDSQNMFYVLSDAAEIEKRLEWVNMYDEVYRDEHNRIEVMIMKKQLAEAELFFKTGQVLSIVEMETWSEEGCRIAEGWDPLVISANLLAQSDQAMHLSVRSLLDNKLLYVSLIYGEITPKSRSRLWRNLRDHVSIAGSEPWILQGDFNVILKSNENSNGLNVRSEGTQDFRECVDYLGVADINMNGLFYTCIQKMKNPELGVLKKLDRIMGNAQFIGPYPDSFVVFMPYLSSGHCPCVLTLPELTTRKPRPFRFMNFLVDKKEFMISVRENWNVGVKGFAMFRLTKRKCLDKDPSNVALREEEMVYASAFKDAALDEEKDVVYEVEDADSLFTKRLNADAALDLINVIVPDLCAVTKEFFVKGKLLSEFNTTLISLVPKVKSPARVIDYRPISYCNVVYKVISKVLTNRLKLVLNDLVDGNQSAFIPRRQSSGNILLAQEFMRNYTWGNMARNCAFKVDILKAYNIVFKAKRGLRQGDPISPYLYTLVIKVLNLMIKRHVRNDGRRGLDEFSLSSGLYPSMSKSEAFFYGLTPEIKNDILMAMPFKEGTLPIKYLGVPLLSKKINVNDCKILIEVIQNRINDWKNRNLSFAGRLLLISSVLASLQARGNNSKSMVSMNWKDVCKPKSQGGLGLNSVCSWNVALMAKHLWNVASDKDSIWVKWVKVYRLKSGNIWDVELKEHRYWSWCQLLKLRDDIRRIIVQVGLSLNARFCDLINNVWIDKKGKEKRFSVAEAWKAVKIEFPKWVSVSVAWSHGRTGLWDGNKVFDSDVLVTGGFLCISLDECLKERYVEWWYMDVLSKCFYGPRRDGNPFLGSNMDYFSLDIHVLMQILVLIVARLRAFQDKQDQSLCQRLLLWYKYEVLGNLGRSCSLFSLLGVFPIGFYLEYGDGSWSADWS
ncbi:hypothetical protein Tco_0251507 [Tanacetum coccineum]